MSNRPNVIVVTCHDLGRFLGCYGVPTVRTPVIDGLAAQGVRFENSFCVAPQCSPSRAAISTGRYPHSNGVMGLSQGGFEWSLNPGERHIASLLGEAGYTTGLGGFQHETHKVDSIGFDAVATPPTFECTGVAEESIKLIERFASGSQPFYLQIGFFEPHRPFDWFGCRPDRELGVTVPAYLIDDEVARDEFAAMQGAVHKVDAAVGEVLEALDAAGCAGDTLFIFTSDHGIPFPRAKCSVYDPGLEVPLILRWPSAPWVPGTVYSDMISNVDYVPTILDLCGIQVPSNVQGVTFAPLLGGGSYIPRSEVFAEMTYHDYCDPRRAIRTSTHKLIVNFTNAKFFMDPSQTWGRKTTPKHPEDVANAFHPPVELYDLERDPLEFENLAQDESCSAVRDELLGRLHDFLVSTADPILDGIPMSPMHRKALSALGV